MTAVVAILALALLAVTGGGVLALRRLGAAVRERFPAGVPGDEPADVLPAGHGPDQVGTHGLQARLDEDRATLVADRARVDRGRAELDHGRADLAHHSAELDRLRLDLAQSRAGLDRDTATLGQARAELAEAQAALAGARAALTTTRSEVAAEREAVAADRARVAGLSPAEARAELMAEALAGARRDASLEVRRIEADAVAGAEVRAREIVAQSVQRLATPTTTEVAVLTLRLPADDYKGRIIGREGRNIRAFETVTGVDVLVDETPDVVQLSCFDPVRREIGRLTMESLLADGRIHPQRIEETHAQAAGEVDRLCRRAAQDAVLAAGVDPVDDALMAHLGALRFRTSYGQNVLAHLVESAGIAATMAAEIGADVALVKRCAFLHDIGKALTHEVEGSHAQVGADLARRHGESAAVVHAIEAHHNEVAPRTVEAVLTQASDACSGGRPGARRESLAAYTERLRRIEEIACAQPGVERVFAVQAGHEVRVMVQPDAVDDLAAAQIARTVAKQIEQELTYPGQVRVTVIRESRVVEVAH